MKRWSPIVIIAAVLASAGLAFPVGAAGPSNATPAAAATPGGPAKRTPKKSAAKAAKPAAPAAATVSGPEVRNFQSFCDEWMQKLRDRETYNTAHITWTPESGHVVGEYVGYGTECTCVAREEPGKDPIGKITYRETRYRREGATPTDALGAPGTILEQSDVTEIFRYGKGRWQY